ncbi:PAS domain S-box protein [Zooshikella marina]|uniref:PAS domain-containing sensor histidine kinase n=1 Tax=Zooshikella ganghwensis TaxID=202772 RepID=UPI001BAEC1C3|nr:ATP-binding protein [Zooshikella ganghwensis]MBU2704879.1 PAS domain S-box protein [Zooshikella ganghwensis]
MDKPASLASQNSNNCSPHTSAASGQFFSSTTDHQSHPLFRKLFSVIAIMCCIVVVMEVVTITTLHGIVIDEQKQHLQNMLKSQAMLLERLTASSSEPLQPSQTSDKTTSPHSDKTILAIQQTFNQLREGEQIFLLEQTDEQELRYFSGETLSPALKTGLQRLIHNRLQTTQISDNNKQYIISYLPLQQHNLSLVGLIDLSDLTTSFLQASLLLGVVTVVLLVLGVRLYQRRINAIMQTLHNNEQKFRILFHSSSQGVIVCDKHHTILECNESSSHIFRAERDELIGKSLLSFSAPQQPTGEPSSTALKRYCDAAASADAQQFVWRAARGDSQLILDVYWKALSLNAEQESVFIATIRDITDEFLIQQQLEEKDHQLQLQREKLMEATRLSTMGEMAAGIAHEINQPLAAISSYAQACQRLLHQNAHQPPSPQVVECLTKITSQTERASQVISHLRGFIGKAATNTHIVSCNQLVTEAISLAQLDCGHRKIPLHLHLSKTSPQLKVDPILLQQALLNLIHNAVEAMADSKDISSGITISTHQLSPDWVEIAVQDTGRGLPKGGEDYLFNPFFSTKSNGLGIGLTISHSIISSHGGKLSYKANPSVGATFFITLPTFVH